MQEGEEGGGGCGVHVWGGDCGAVADGLGGVGVRGVGGEVGAVDLGGLGLAGWGKEVWGGGGTDSIAFLTRSEVMRPFLARLFIKAVLVEPEENQAMV